ncbi:ribonuclease HII [Timonella senegalensis]|uniref:ribonuclease HII n=2 Tax=Timonella senegalensis TaxID=1465825 RepID=UPI0002F65CC3|nr:ribonuclease HII [Timonella senegalensis]
MNEDVAGNYLFAVTPTQEDTARALVVKHHEALLKRKAQPGAAKQRVYADLTHERSLIERGSRLVAGMDEVGRGALAGPVVVGVCVVGADTVDPPIGLTDSKEISPDMRDAYVPLIQGWSTDYAVGSASPQEIDEHGIIGALRLAGQRAIASVESRLGPIDTVLLDGSHDWLTEPETDLFSLLEETPDVAVEGYTQPKVVTRVKADLACAAVSGASVIAKVARDRLMSELDTSFPQYGWVTNKGYGSSGHAQALRDIGTTIHHRLSWHLPGAGETAGDGE